MYKAMSVAIVVALLIAFGAGIARTQLPDQRETFMRVKLVRAQRLLEALVQEDYDMMVREAQGMKLLSQDASWEVYQGVEYEQRSIAFRRSAEALTTAAKQRNLDGATLAHIELTLSCISCHKYIRREQSAESRR